MELRKLNKKSSYNKFFFKYFLWHILSNLFANTFISRNKIRGYLLKLFELKLEIRPVFLKGYTYVAVLMISKMKNLRCH